MANSRSVNAAIGELLLAAVFWGFGFIATVWALQKIDAFELTLLRFVIASCVGLPFVLLYGRGVMLRYWRLSLWPSVLLVGNLLFQTWGMEYTTPTKSGFITTLYVVLVPLLEARMTGRPLGRVIWVCVGLALLGTALIVDLGYSPINIGDVLTMICTLFAAVQIYWMGQISGKIERPFVFNAFQCFWAVPLAFPFVHLSTLHAKLAQCAVWPPTVWAGIISLSLGSTVLAFFLQVRSQSKLSATVSSLIFLLESPLALMFAVVLLGQSLNALESVGAALIFFSAFMATWIEGREKKLLLVENL